MSNGDAPAGTLDTYPNYRHLVGAVRQIFALNQLLIPKRRVVHDNPLKQAA